MLSRSDEEVIKHNKTDGGITGYDKTDGGIIGYDKPDNGAAERGGPGEADIKRDRADAVEKKNDRADAAEKNDRPDASAVVMDRLDAVAVKYEEIGARLSDPDVVNDQREYRRLMREHKAMTPLVEKYRKYRETLSARDEAYSLLSDPELREMAQAEYNETRARAERLEEEIRLLLLPRDPNDDRNVIVEIRGGAGGEEAALFASSLYRMYTMYAVAAGYRYDLLGVNETGLGGFKEVSFMIRGEGAYSRFKFESGVHRVQRVPATENSGRIHTSTVTVAVLPEADEVEVEILPQDLVIETCKSSGAGGQHINKTESAIRILHKPSGLVVECQEERSQLQNKEKALFMLRTKLYDIKRREQFDQIAGERRSQVGTGDRSERIRTYNFPQGRVTDHRIGLTLYSLDSFMNGDIGEMIDALIAADTAEKLKSREGE